MLYFFVENFHHRSESKTILPVAYHRYFPAFASPCVAIGWSISRHFLSQLYTKPKPIIQSLLVFYLYNLLTYIIYMLTSVLVSRYSTEVTKVCLVYVRGPNSWCCKINRFWSIRMFPAQFKDTFRIHLLWLRELFICKIFDVMFSKRARVFWEV